MGQILDIDEPTDEYCDQQIRDFFLRQEGMKTKRTN